MKKLIALLVLIALAAGGYVAWPQMKERMRKRNLPTFNTKEVVEGEIEWSVQATGKLEPVLKVQIGSFVSGPIAELYCDFNDQVKKDDILAKVDPRIYEAAVQRDQAALSRAQADVERVKSRLQQAVNDETRARKLQKINNGYISQSEMDQLRFSRQAQQAELKVAELQIEQARANLDNSMLNLDYTEIRAPEDGVIIDRKIDPGQTLAAQFQTPELFTLAPEMDRRMWVHASVVEADVGHIRKAQDDGRPVEFYVDAYEGELFEGQIIQVRQNPSEESNVVTYPVIVETTNPGLKLMPGMTANLSFQVDRNDKAIKIPGAAIRFVPDRRYVREEDHKILDGDKEEKEVAQESSQAKDRVESLRKRRTRYVWMKHDEEKLRAVKIEFGITDGRYYELVEGDLKAGDELVHSVEAGGGWGKRN